MRKQQQLQNTRNQQLTNIQKTSLRNLDGDKDVGQTLVYTALMVGLKPEKIEIDIIVRFVKKNYPSLTLENIIEAFELNSSNKHWKIVEPYGSYNTIFVGKI